eukprot:3743529-Amphidinium_carterae.1
MITEKRNELDLGLRRLQTGVDKIDEANAVVNSLQQDRFSVFWLEELTKLQPYIEIKMKEAEELIPVVTEEQQKAA